ncbi:MAG: dethiobiotin synthase [Parachlamydiaceae bacterium]|nr:dethiobiotin synthase [Parachlamydiaceae bacterium]
MTKIIVAGIGTDVGKTVVSAVLMTALQADYWKPVQCSDVDHSDCQTIRQFVPNGHHRVYTSAYTFKAPLSPHHAARLQNVQIDINAIKLPETNRPLIIESCGGIFVPLSKAVLTIDLFCSWKVQWILVSRHYTGSINHTLLTIEAMKSRGIDLLGLIFNGEPNPDSEEAILAISKVNMIGRLLPEPILNPQIIQRYAKQWHLPS